ncbi:MAG: hypothetical protein SGARI_002989, partial [Bacillariaceae sp.]
MPNYLSQALTIAISRGKDTFSKFENRDESQKKLIQVHLNCVGFNDQFNETCKQVVFAEKYRWVYVTPSNTVGVIHSVSQILTDPMDHTSSKTVGIASDKIASTSVGTLASNESFNKFVVSIVNKKEAQNLKFVVLAGLDPDALPKPDDSTYGFEELGFENFEDDDSPKLVALPKLMPIPSGYWIPVGAKINQDLQSPPEGYEFSPEFPVWFAGMKFLASNNAFKSITHNNFYKSDCVNWDETVEVDFLKHAEESLAVNIERVIEGSAVYPLAIEKIQPKIDAMIIDWYSGVDLSDSEEARLNGSPTGSAGASQLNDSLINLRSVKGDSSSKVDNKLTQTYTAGWSAALGHIESQPSGDTYVPANLSEGFTDIISIKNKSARAQQLRETFNEYVQIRKEADDIIGFNSDWNPLQMDSPMSNAICEFAVMTESVEQGAHSL